MSFSIDCSKTFLEQTYVSLHIISACIFGCCTMSMVLKASPASNPFNPLRGSESFLSSSESRKMPSRTHYKSSQEQPSGVVWCVILKDLSNIPYFNRHTLASRKNTFLRIHMKWYHNLQIQFALLFTPLDLAAEYGRMN